MKGAVEVETSQGRRLIACVNGSRYVFVIDRQIKTKVKEVAYPSAEGAIVGLKHVSGSMIVIKDKENISVFNAETMKIQKLFDCKYQATQIRTYSIDVTEQNGKIEITTPEYEG